MRNKLCLQASIAYGLQKMEEISYVIVVTYLQDLENIPEFGDFHRKFCDPCKKSSSGLIYRGNKTTTKNKKVYEQNL